MTHIYNPPEDQMYRSGGKGTYYRLEDNKEWNTFQCYETKEDTKTVVCKNCGNKEFKVGIGDHFTTIKCSNCTWEECVHDG